MSTPKSSKKPCIALPLGDPAGIGPEIVLKALSDPELRKLVCCLVNAYINFHQDSSELVPLNA